MALTPGDIVLERYRVDALVGEGGMGKVYRATHVRTGQQVALKILHAVSSEAAVRFEREACLMARVRHPNVVTILDYGRCPQGAPCIAMELATGQTLEERLERRGPVPWFEALDVLLGVLDGLEAIHQAELLHRDLKPDNIVTYEQSGLERVKLLDFGIAVSLRETDRLTHQGDLIGTPAYMAPEQLIDADVDARADLFSAALIAYELTTGALPFPSGSIVELATRVQRRAPEPATPAGLPEIEPAFAESLLRALDPDPDARYPNARVFARELRELRRACGLGRRPTGAYGTLPRPGPVEASARRTPPLELRRTEPGQRSARARLASRATLPWGTLPDQVRAELDPAPDGRAAARARTPMPGPAVPDACRTMDLPAAGRRVTRQGGTTRLLVLGRAPVARLDRPDARAWLDGLVAPRGRSLYPAPSWWCGLIETDDPAELTHRMRALHATFERTLGPDARLACAPVPPEFDLCPEQLDGRRPRPPELDRLASRLR